MPKQILPFQEKDVIDGKRQILEVSCSGHSSIENLVAELEVNNEYAGKLKWSELEEEVEKPEIVWKPNNEREYVTRTVRLSVSTLSLDFLHKGQTEPLPIWNGIKKKNNISSEIWLNTDYKILFRVDEWKGKTLKLEVKFFAKNALSGKSRFTFNFPITDFDKLQMTMIE